MASHPKGMNCLQANVGRGHAAVDELKTDVFGSVDVFLLQEMPLRDGHVLGLPLGWKVIHQKEGKAAVAISDVTLRATEVYTSARIAAAEFGDATGRTTVVSFYFPPREDIRLGLEELEALLDRIGGGKIVLGGDTNAHDPLWGPVSSHRGTGRGSEMTSFLLRRGLTLWNDPHSAPTFVGPNGSSWIDVTFSSASLNYAAGSWKVVESTLSDHNYIAFDLTVAQLENSMSCYSRNAHRLQRMAKSVAAQSEPLLVSIRAISCGNDIDQVVDEFTTLVKSACDRHLSTRAGGKKKVQWWDDELNILRKKTIALKRRFRSAKDANNRAAARIAFNKGKSEYKRSILDKKRKSWELFCHDTAKTSPWSLPYKLAAGKISRAAVLASVKRNDGSDTTSEADTINEIVSALFHSDTGTNDSTEHAEMRNVASCYSNTDLDIDFTETEVGSVIKRMANRKAPGLDGVTKEIAAAIFGKVPSLLCSLFNACLTWGHFPAAWKRARLVLIPKPGKPRNDRGSYRPICLLPVTGKILDKLFTQRLFYHLKKQGKLNPQQFGFRPGQSCETALHALMGKVRDYHAAGKSVCLVSLDVAGAFDSVWWPSVLSLLARAECPGNLFNLVRSYLSNRSMTYESPQSKLDFDVERGCPQGSCSGPLLWNLVADEALEALPDRCYVQAYADDLIVMVPGKDREEIERRGNRALRKMKEWADRFKMTFNPQKVEVMPITFGGRFKEGGKPILRLGGESLKNVTEMKYLGVIWDEKLSFTQHFKRTKSKIELITSQLLATAKNLYRFDRRLLKTIYTGAIERIALYGIGAWGCRLPLKGCQDRLDAMLRQPLLAMTGGYRTTAGVSLHVLAGIPPLSLKAKSEFAKFNLTALKQDFVSDAAGLTMALNANDYVQPWDVYSVHPAERLVISFDNIDPSNFGNEIFTDGSAIDGAVGGAF